MLAETIAKALSGRKVGAEWQACCPAHQDRRPSLSLTNRGGKLLAFCHAGCSQGSVIAALKRQGLWPKATSMSSSTRPVERPLKPVPPPSDELRRQLLAMKIWKESTPIVGTSAAMYLSVRGLLISDLASLRYHSDLKHKSGKFWPAMVALIQDGASGAPIGVHRTYLDPSGSGKAPVENPKMMLGQCRGGAVKFGTYTDQIAVAEGLETALSVFQALQIPTWAALSCSGLKSLALPPEIRNVFIMADGDEPGEKAAMFAATRWQRDGRNVRICRAPYGYDFNDVLSGLDRHGDRHGH